MRWDTSFPKADGIRNNPIQAVSRTFLRELLGLFHTVTDKPRPGIKMTCRRSSSLIVTLPPRSWQDTASTSRCAH